MNHDTRRFSRLFSWMLLLGALALIAAPVRATPALDRFAQASNDNSNGEMPVAGLIQGSDGNFYGTTASGGTFGSGTVFKITPSGTLTTLYSFSAQNNGINADGANPYAALVEGSDGDFYGTTLNGGSSNGGTVFKITSLGALTTLVNFYGGNGLLPRAPLVQGSNGNFFGTTELGGSDGGLGTVFEMTPSGTLTMLFSFNNNYDGDVLLGGLVEGNDGNFYGTTNAAGNPGEGTVFEITPGDYPNTLVNFNNTNGSYPAGTLVLGSDGDFYGTTQDGGSSGMGTVFKMTATGALTTLVSFTGANGGNPQAALVLGSDGDFYGVTDQGGSANDGTVFKMTPAGMLTILYRFSATDSNGINSDGQYPKGLVEGSDGDFYGTAQQGGANGTGTIFKITPGGVFTTLLSFNGSTGAPPVITGFSPASGSVGTTVTITGSNLTGTSVVGFMDQHAKSFTINAAGTQITATVPAGAMTGPVAVLTNGIEAKSSMNFTVTPPPPAPTITGFTPASGSVGAAVTITGTNLTGTTIVGFMGKHAKSFTVNAAGTQITTTVPSGAQTGPVAVLTNGIEAKSPTSFTVTP